MSEEFYKISQDFKILCVAENRGDSDLQHIGDVAVQSLRLLTDKGTKSIAQGQAVLDGVTKQYELRSHEGKVSRPIRKDLFIADPDDFAGKWRDLVSVISSARFKIPSKCALDSTLYTAVIAFAVSYDLYMPGSRKTPGTYFEMMVGAILGALTRYPRFKQIDLPDSRYKVPTDIVLRGPKGKPSLVIPTKITTRERIVQAWAHHRILSDVYPGQYKSVLAVVSELQRDKDTGINEICVPGQVGLFQRYLAQMNGMYYLDPPASYTTDEFQKLLPVRPFSSLLTGDLIQLLEAV